MANVVKITIDASSAGAQAELAKVKTSFGELTEAVKANRKQIGVALTAVGAGITAVAGLSVKAAQEEQVGINRLGQALKNVGQSYEGQKASIEAVIAAQQRKTNYGDGPQRDALQKLITVSGQYEGSLEALVVAQDVAAGAGIDLEAAALLVGKALAGETGSLSRYGIQLEQGATQTEILTALTRQFGGAAEAAADPFAQLKNQLGDVVETLGAQLLPIVTAAVAKLAAITAAVQAWAQEHPELARFLTITAVAIGGLMAVVGPLLLMLPALATGIRLVGLAFGTMGGPVGLVVLAIGTLITAALLLRQHWDTVWSAIVSATEFAVNLIIKGINFMTKGYRDGIALLLQVAQKVVAVFNEDWARALQGVIDKLRAGIGPIDITRERTKELGEEVKETADVTTKGLDRMGAGFTGLKDKAEAVLDATKAMVRAFGDDLKDEFETTADDEIRIFLAGLKHRADLAEESEKAAALAGEAERKRLLAAAIKGNEALAVESKSAAQAFVAALKERVEARLKTQAEEERLLETHNDRVRRLVEDQANAITQRNRQLADQNAKAFSDMRQGIESSWRGVMDAIDPVLSKLGEFGITATQIIKAWASETGVEAARIVAYLTGVGIKGDDLKTVFNAFASAVGLSMEEAAAFVARSSRSMIASLQSVKEQVASGFAETGQRAFRVISGTGQVVASDPSVVPTGFDASKVVFADPALVPQGQGGGTVGRTGLALIHKGENIIPAGHGGGLVINLTFNGDIMADDFEQRVQRAVRDALNAGGFPQLARV